MQSINKRHISVAMMFSLLALLMVGAMFTGCKDDDDSDNGTQIWAIGPGNVDRGGVLKITGQKLGDVSAVILPSLDGNGITVSRSEFQTADDDHIEIKLPNDKNFVSGNVIVKFSNGNQITSKVAIRVGNLVVEGFSPATAKPGQEITITGEYLTLVQSVVFASNQEVSKDNFKSQTDDKIVVAVPAAAQTGAIAVSDGDGAAYSDNKLTVTLPSNASFTAKSYKPGVDKITITGKDLDLVSTVKFDGAEVVVFDTKNDNELTFKVPSSVKAGDVTLITASEISIKAGTIAVSSPTINDVAYADNLDYYLLGQSVKFTGKDLDLISSIKLGGVDVKKSDFTIASDNNSITITLAEDVKSNATFITDNGTTIEKGLKIVPFVVFGSENDTPNGQVNVNCGGTTEIKGQNLQYLKGVNVFGFNATDIEIKTDGTSATFFVVSQAAGNAPGTWANDKFVTTASNGENIVQSTWANAPAKPYFLTLPKNAESGTSIMVSGSNFDKINGIKMGGVDVVYSLVNANNIFINIPASLSEDTYAIEMTYDGDQIDKSSSLKVASSVMVLWSGESQLAWDATKASFLSNVDISELEVGGLLKIYMKQLSNDPAWSYLGFRIDEWTEDANWPQANLSQVAPGEEMVWSVKLTQEQLNVLPRLYIYGEGNTAITKITFGEKE